VTGNPPPAGAPGVPFGDALERSRQDERRRALRALLMQPLLRADHPAFPLLRRHAEELREWLLKEAGWPLRLEGDMARLLKRPADLADPTRAARPPGRANEPAFSRRRYALLCLALAALERGEGQTTLGRLGQAMMAAAAEPDLAATGLVFELDAPDQRRDLVAVVRLLLGLGVLTRVAGDEEGFVRRRDQDVLYDVDRRVLSTALVTARGPSLLEVDEEPPVTLEQRLAAIAGEFVADTPEARNRALRQRLTRRLLDDPVVYWDELDEDERAYLMSQRGAIVRRIEEATGLVAEVRAEGLAMVDAGGDLSDQRMPAEGTEGHATLLLADYLAERLRAGEVPVPWDDLHQRLRDWAQTYRGYWKKSAREPGAEQDLARHAAERLAALRLAAWDDQGIHPLPAIARYGLGAPRVPGDGGQAQQR
jgi:uncharacterized protein (TIGR02678 family)